MATVTPLTSYHSNDFSQRLVGNVLLIVLLSTAPVPLRNDTLNAPIQTLFPTIGPWCRTAS